MCEASGQLQVSSSATLSTTSDSGSRLGLEFTIASGTLPFLAPQHWDSKHIPPYLAFCVDAGDRSQVLVLVNQILYQVPPSSKCSCTRLLVVRKLMVCENVMWADGRLSGGTADSLPVVGSGFTVQF